MGILALQGEATMWAALAVAVLAVFFMLGLSRRARAQSVAPPDGSQSSEAMLLRFVEDADGKRRGETVAVDGDAFIVKEGESFYRLPQSHVTEQGGKLRLEGTVDWDAARKEGDAWRERSHKVITYTEAELPKDDE